MQKLLIILFTVVLLITGCSEVSEIEELPTENIRIFKYLFGDEYEYAKSDDAEWFIAQKLNEGYIELISFTSRKVYRYELTEEFKLGTVDNPLKLKRNARRRVEYNEMNDLDILQGNLYLLIRDNLTVIESDKKGNLNKNVECEPITINIVPQIKSVIESAQAIEEVLNRYDLKFYLTHNYTVVAILNDKAYISKYGVVSVVPIKGPLPDTPAKPFSDVYFQLNEDKSENTEVLQNYGISNYENVILYGDYYLCIDNDGTSQMLYNKATDFYEWVKG